MTKATKAKIQKVGMLILFPMVILAMVFALAGGALVAQPKDAYAVDQTTLEVILHFKPDQAEFSVCQYFSLAAEVRNIGDETATNVQATIGLDGRVETDDDLTKPVGKIGPGGRGSTAWALHCAAAGPSTISVTVTADNAPEVVQSIEIVQENPAELEVEITEPEDGAEFSVCQNFTVGAVVSNIATDPAADAVDVGATIDFGPSMELVSPDPTQPLGTIVPGSSVPVSWTVHCFGANPSDFIRVTARGHDSNSQAPVSDFDEITVAQVNAAELDVDITEPTDGAQFSVCQNFTVTAMVSNTAIAPAADAVEVNATITFGDNMELLSPDPTQFLGTISSGSPVTVSWEMHCLEVSLDDFITVTADGYDANTGAPVIASDTIYVDQVNRAELEVEIMEPDDGAEFTVCQGFRVTAEVSNVGVFPAADAMDVTATITFGDNIELVSPGVTQFLGTIESGSPVTVSWEMHCRAASLEDFITVTAEGEDAGTGAPISASDTIYVDQVNPAELGVEIMEPDDGAEFTVCQYFLVTAEVSNVAPHPEADAVEVTATIAFGLNMELVSPGATQFLGTIPSDESVTVSWEMHCLEASPNDFITVNAEGYDANTGALTVASDTIHVDQVNHAELAVDITEPDDGAEFTVCQYFTVTAEVSNVALAPAADAVEVTATITFGDNMELVSPDPTQFLGTIEVGSPATVSWEMHCSEASLEDFITVTAEGYDAITGDPLSASDEIYVDQVNPAELGVEIVEPLDGAEFAVCQYFMVTAVVSNVGVEPEADAVDVNATITFGDNMELVSPGATQFLGTIESGTPVMVSWEMHCLAPSLDDFITVTAEGEDANTGVPTVASDTINVDQLKAHLTVNITAPETSTMIGVFENFMVEATVENTGNGPASEVTATISIDGPASLVGGELPEKPVVPSALGPGEWGVVSWELHCDAACDVTITVTAAGMDDTSGLEIPEENRTPDSVIVHQMYLIPLCGPDAGYEGWNLISLMVEPDDPDIGDLLAGIQEHVISVWYYDASTGEWFGNTPNGGTWPGDLLTMEDGKGYWIQVSEATVLAFKGTEVVPPEPGPNVPASYPVYMGWNLVGFSSVSPMYADEYFFAPYYNGELKCIWAFYCGTWEQYILWNIESLELIPGRGYWIWVSTDTEIVVPWHPWDD